MSTMTVEDRIVLLVRSVCPAYGAWAALEEATGIAAKRWRNVATRHQRATSDMISALAITWPQYAFWLVTGITDAISGHMAPVKAETFPERLAIESHAATEYFSMALNVLEVFCEEAHLPSDDEQRVAAFERTHWEPWKRGPLVNTVAAATLDDRYEELMRLWRSREIERINRYRKVESAALGELGSRDMEWEMFHRRDGRPVTSHLPPAVMTVAERFPTTHDFATFQDGIVALMDRLPDTWTEMDLIVAQTWLRRADGPAAWPFLGYLAQHGLLPASPFRIPFGEREIEHFESLVRNRRGVAR